MNWLFLLITPVISLNCSCYLDCNNVCNTLCNSNSNCNWGNCLTDCKYCTECKSNCLSLQTNKCYSLMPCVSNIGVKAIVSNILNNFQTDVHG